MKFFLYTLLALLTLSACTKYSEDNATLVCAIKVHGQTPWQLAADIADKGNQTFVPEEVNHITAQKAYIEGWYNTNITANPYREPPYDDGFLPAEVICDCKDGKVTHALIYCKILDRNESIKLIKGSKEISKPKNILKFLLKEELTNDLDEIPNSILMQRLNYSKGNLALKCGHYMTAIKKFQKVFLKSSDKITDVKITVKSYKKLIKIAELMKSKCNYINKKTEENILNQYIKDKTNELKKFVSSERNFIILISTNTDNLDFFINSLENAVYIIDNYIKGNDRFCLAFASSDSGLGGGMKVIVKLEEKDKQNNDGLINYIQDIKQDYDLLSSYEENGEDDIKFILQKVKIFSSHNERKNYYIFFGNKSRLSHESTEFLCGKEINSFLEEDKEKLILIMHENYETIENKNIEFNSLIPVEEKIFDVNKLNGKLCSYIHFDDIQKIKEDVMIYGNINSLDNYFNFEKYEMKKYD